MRQAINNLMPEYRSLAERTTIEHKVALLLHPIGGPEAPGPSGNDLSRDVIGFAKERGKFDKERKLDEAGNLNLGGLLLLQEEPGEQDPLTYVVNQRVLTTKKVEYTEGPRQWKIKKRGMIREFHEVGSKRKIGHEVDKKVSVIDLDVYDSLGNLVSQTSYDGSRISPEERGIKKDFLKQYPDGLGEFLLFLDSHGPKLAREKRETANYKMGHFRPAYVVPVLGNRPLPRGPVTTMGWGAEQPKPPFELSAADRYIRHIPVDDTQDIVDQVLQDRERLNLPGMSMYGFTLMQGDHTLQITGDNLLHGNDESGQHLARTWVVSEYDKKGRPVSRKQRVYRDGELQTLLNKRKPDSREWAYHHPHWQIDKKTLEAVEAAKRTARKAAIGRTAMRRLRASISNSGPSLDYAWEKPGVGNRDLSSVEARLILNGIDVYDEEKVLEKVTTPMSKAEEVREDKIITSLQRVITRFGVTEVSIMAEKVRDAYVETAKGLGLPIPEERTSISWMLRYMAEQYAARHSALDDFMKDETPTSEHIQRSIVDQAIGLAFLGDGGQPNGAVAESIDGEPILHIDSEGFVEKKHRAIKKFEVNEGVVDNLQEFVKPQIKLLLDKIAKARNNNEQLDEADVKKLGRLLQRQIQL